MNIGYPGVLVLRPGVGGGGGGGVEGHYPWNWVGVCRRRFPTWHMTKLKIPFSAKMGNIAEIRQN